MPVAVTHTLTMDTTAAVFVWLSQPDESGVDEAVGVEVGGAIVVGAEVGVGAAVTVETASPAPDLYGCVPSFRKTTPLYLISRVHIPNMDNSHVRRLSASLSVGQF